MRVVVIVDSLNLSGSGGVGTCVNDLCIGFQAAQVISNVYLIGIVGNKQEDPLVRDLKKNGVKIYSLGARTRKDAITHLPIYAKQLRSIVKGIAKDELTVCNLHLKLGVLIGTAATIGLSNIRRIETYHNTYHHYWFQCSLLRPFIAKYICVSSAAKEEMRTRFCIPEKKLVAIPNGVSRAALREKVYNIETKSTSFPNILTVGRLSYEKNILLAAKAIVNMGMNDFRYIIVGDGPQHDELINIISSSDNIEYRGALPREDVLSLLCASDVVLIPSLWEGRSIFMLEAAAFDKPFILSDCPGLREPFGEPELGDNENIRVCKFGYLVKTNEIDGYQVAIRHFIDHPELHLEMASAVREMSLNNDISTVISKYIKEMAPDVN